MISLPIVERELGIASRKLGSWLSRWIIAIVAVCFGGLWLGIAYLQGGLMQGDIFFAILAWACFVYCLLAGLWTTSDTLTREKTDGTLGLLFLTDLRGYDVVLGKMITASLKSFYGVLAVLPVLALPLLMGGVTSDQFWRTAGALLNILIFSLSLGMFFSAASWSTGRAIFWTLLSLLSVTMLPLIHFWLSGTASILNFVSPGFAMASASAPVIGTPVAGFSGYWTWLGGGLAVSGTLLALASWIIPHRWRETKLRPQTPILAERVDGDRLQPSAERQSAMLDTNPAGWLVWRVRSFRTSRRLLMALMITFGLALLGFVALEGAGIDDVWIFMASLIWVGSFWIRLEVARHAVTTIHEAKTSGALEQILVTPVDERQFRRGHFIAMVRFWMWPVIVLASLPIVAALLSMLMTGWISDDALFGVSIMGLMSGLIAVVFFGDLFALYYSGCWFALRSNSYSAAFWKTFGFVYLLPTIGSVFLCWLGQFVWLITDIIFIVWPLTSLQGNFRRVVSGEYGIHYVRPLPPPATAPTPPVIDSPNR
jgi:ABC-type transport system involved in cytochrome c biogenesis permease component